MAGPDRYRRLSPDVNSSNMHGAGDNENRDRAARFRALALPHLDDVYTLARYLLRNATDAEDATQEAYLRALHHFDTYRGPAIKPWLFAIVRNICHDVRKPSPETLNAGDRPDGSELKPLWSDEGATPEFEVLRQQDAQVIRRLLHGLPEAFREVVVLREIEELSYREIADIIGVPVGTVMSRLARGRALLRAAWIAADGAEDGP